MSFQVEITDAAYRDLDEILGWLSDRSPLAAARLAAQFEKLCPAWRPSPSPAGWPTRVRW